MLTNIKNRINGSLDSYIERVAARGNAKALKLGYEFLFILGLTFWSIAAIVLFRSEDLGMNAVIAADFVFNNFSIGVLTAIVGAFVHSIYRIKVKQD